MRKIYKHLRFSLEGIDEYVNMKKFFASYFQYDITKLNAFLQGKQTQQTV